jgi:hypothetical protein
MGTKEESFGFIPPKPSSGFKNAFPVAAEHDPLGDMKIKSDNLTFANDAISKAGGFIDRRSKPSLSQTERTKHFAC